MKLGRRNFLLGSAAAATLAGCATNKVGLRTLKPGEKAAAEPRRKLRRFSFMVCSLCLGVLL